MEGIQGLFLSEVIQSASNLHFSGPTSGNVLGLPLLSKSSSSVSLGHCICKSCVLQALWPLHFLSSSDTPGMKWRSPAETDGLLEDICAASG